jgi:hypothetical protein
MAESVVARGKQTVLACGELLGVMARVFSDDCESLP